jgi:iron complex outermembrane recepter protein
MKFQRKKLAGALAYALGVGGAFAVISTPVQAVITVDVTGSNIKRVEGEGALPVQVLTREDLQNAGVTDIAQVIDKISASQSFGNFNTALGEGANFVGFTAASLRGLGSQRTLILLNGKRIAAYALSDSSGVDLNAIPFSALERVEVLKDGASAIYGTDAIAGVINFITRKDYTGAEVNISYLDSQGGGGSERRYTGTAGWGDLSKNGFNAWITADYFEQGSLRASDREISKTAYIPELGIDRTSGNSLPANISGAGLPGTRNPGNPACIAPFSFPTNGSPKQCRFDFASVIDTIPPAEKTSIIGRATFQINPDHQAFVEASYFHGDYTQAISPTPVSSAFTFILPVQIAPGTAFYPAAFIAAQGGDPTKPVSLSYRALEFGPRTDEAKVDQYRLVAGLQGVVKGWDYSAAFNYTGNKQVDAYTNGYLSEAKFVPLIDSGVINPFGFNTPAAIAAGNAAKITGDASTNKASNYGVDGKVSNEIWQLPAGPVAMALGAEYRKESLELTNADFLSSGDIIGGLGAIPSLPKTTRNVWAVYTEFNIPILKNLEGNIAVRYDKYSDIGSTTNPKLSLRWQPTKEFLLRGSYGTGYRVPTLFDLFQPTYTTNTNNSFDDPIRCPVTQSVFDCNLQFNSQRGGNPKLQPEKSKQYYVGGVWEPVQNLSMGLDYYWIEIRNVIQFFGADTIFGDYNAYQAQYIVRKPPDAQFPNLPGQIAYVIEPQVNVGKQLVDGIDVDASYKLASSVGTFMTKFTGSYIMHWKQTSLDGLTYPNFVGTAGQPQGAIARWRHNLTVDWSSGAWGATVAETFQNSYSEPDLTSDDPNALRKVKAYDIWDVQGRFTGIKNVTLALGVRNVFDKAPPQSSSPGTFQVGYDASYADPRGRMFYGNLRVAFK